MGKNIILMAISLMSINIYGQESMKKIQLEEGINDIKYNDLNIAALLQVYDEKSAAHLIGDVFLRLDHNEESIANFYVDNDKSTKVYFTRIYKNYFLTFLIEKNNKYLIIEKARFGKAFALSSNGTSTIGDIIEIEIKDYILESGYDAPPEDADRNYFSDVKYTLKVKVKNVVKNFSFYSSEVKENPIIEVEGYCIQILSDKYEDSSSQIEMKLSIKEGKSNTMNNK
jgi:hypothetical protein